MLKWKQSETILNKYSMSVYFDVRRQQRMDFFPLEKVLFWIMDLYFGQNCDSFKLKCLDWFVSYKHTSFHFTRC